MSPPAGRDRQGEASPANETRPSGARVAVAFTVIAAILAAFLYRVAAADPVQPWLVALVTVLGLAAAAAVLGTDAVRTAFVGLRQLRR